MTMKRMLKLSKPCSPFPEAFTLFYGDIFYHQNRTVSNMLGSYLSIKTVAILYHFSLFDSFLLNIYYRDLIYSYIHA